MITPDDAMEEMRLPHEWNTVGEGTPLNVWLRTKREGESGENVCFCRLMCIGDEPEWVTKEGVTTVTHGTFAPPTHWRFCDDDPITETERLAYRRAAKALASAQEKGEADGR